MISRSVIPVGNKKCSHSGMDAELIEGRSRCPRTQTQRKEDGRRAPKVKAKIFLGMKFNSGLKSTGARLTLISEWCVCPPLKDA